MLKLKWFVPAVLGMLLAAGIAQNAHAGISAVVCGSGDAVPQSDELQLVYISESTSARPMSEMQAKEEAMGECRREGCSRCEHVCSGEGTLFMSLSFKLFGELWVMNCSMQQAERGLSVERAESIYASRGVETAATSCETRLRSLGDYNRCERARAKKVYHDEPQNRPFVGHVY